MNTLTKIGLAAAGIIVASKIVAAQQETETPAPADIKIVEGSFSVTPNTCPSTGACTITATATWRNTGGLGTVTPAFAIDGVTHSGTPVTLSQNETTEYSISVPVAAPVDGTHRVCPSPNP